MKDVQGVERGRCTACDCKGFICATPGAVKCEYCDHAPRQHVRVELGECTSLQCVGGNCKKYMTEGSTTELSACAYCGCEASDHKAQEESTPTPNAPPTASKPTNLCVVPGCMSPKYVEGYKTHDFCSKTCAKKYLSLQGQDGLPTRYAPPTQCTPYLSSTPPTASKLANLCIVPGCMSPKYVEGYKIHDFCTRTCAKKYQSFQNQGTAKSTHTSSTTTHGTMTYARVASKTASKDTLSGKSKKRKK